MQAQKIIDNYESDTEQKKATILRELAISESYVEEAVSKRKTSALFYINLLLFVTCLIITIKSEDVLLKEFFKAASVFVCLNLFRILSKNTNYKL